jgi:glucokinase
MNQIKIQNKFAVGADIGGSHITCQLFDLEKNKPVEGSKTRLPVDSSDTKEKILDSWATAIMKAAQYTN